MTLSRRTDPEASRRNALVFVLVVLSLILCGVATGCGGRNSKGPVHSATFAPSFALTIANTDSYAWPVKVIIATRHPLSPRWVPSVASVAYVGTLAPFASVTVWMQIPEGIHVRQGDPGWPGGWTDHTRSRHLDYPGRLSLRVEIGP